MIPVTVYQTKRRFPCMPHVTYKINDYIFQVKHLQLLFFSFSQPLCKWKKKALPDTTWIKLNILARGSVHSTTKLKKSRSIWNGAQQIAKTMTRTTGMEKREEKKTKSVTEGYGSVACTDKRQFRKLDEGLNIQILFIVSNFCHPFCLTIIS